MAKLALILFFPDGSTTIEKLFNTMQELEKYVKLNDIKKYQVEEVQTKTTYDRKLVPMPGAERLAELKK